MRVTLLDEDAPRALLKQNRWDGERLSEIDLCEERKKTRF